MENKEKFKELMQDEEFVTKLLELQTPEEVQEEFKKEDIDISVEEVEQLGSIINYMIKEGKNQLTEDDLGKISGGATTGITGGKYTNFIAGVIGTDPDKIREGRGKKWGETEALIGTALLFIPFTIGLTDLVKWGIKRLTNEFDNQLDKKKQKKS